MDRILVTDNSVIINNRTTARATIMAVGPQGSIITARPITMGDHQATEGRSLEAGDTIGEDEAETTITQETKVVMVDINGTR
jgi:hypothetical protein